MSEQGLCFLKEALLSFLHIVTHAFVCDSDLIGSLCIPHGVSGGEILFDGHPCVQIQVSSNVCNPEAALAQRLSSLSAWYSTAGNEAQEALLPLHISNGDTLQCRYSVPCTSCSKSDPIRYFSTWEYTPLC